MTITEDVFSDALELLGLGTAIPDTEDPRIKQEPITYPITINGKIRNIQLHRVQVQNYTVQSMAYYIWNASLLMLNLITSNKIKAEGNLLELGAGVGLPGIVCACLDKCNVVVSEYVDEGIMDVLRKNVTVNEGNYEGSCVAVAHNWGSCTDELLKFAPKGFDVILVADCVWMVEQHENLLKSVKNVLNKEGKVYVSCYPHTGKLNVENFLKASEKMGLKWEMIYSEGKLYDKEFTISHLIYYEGGKEIKVDEEMVKRNYCYVLSKI